MDKLQNIHTIRRRVKNIFQKWEIYYLKIENILLITYFSWNYAISYGQVQILKRVFIIKIISLI